MFEAVDVIYNEQVFKARLEEAFKHHDDGKLLKSIKEMDVTDINFIKFVNRLNGLSACYKSAFYKEEDEVRCITFGHKRSRISAKQVYVARGGAK